MAGYRPPYTWQEERDIVQYILDKKAHYRTRGDALWKEMSKSGIVDRTWHSLKQHFRKKMIYELNSAHYGLSQKDQSDLKRAYNDTERKPNTLSESSGSSDEGTSSQKNSHSTTERTSRSTKRVDRATQCRQKKLKDLDQKDCVDFLEIDFDSDETD